jgi:hypothetical protein
MVAGGLVVLALWLAAEPSKGIPDPTVASGGGTDDDISSLEGNRGAGASPFELVPRLELRQSFVQVGGGVSLHDTTTQIDIEFIDRVLLRYEGTLRVVAGPSGQTSGFGDVRLQAIGILASGPRYVLGALVGAVLDTASQPALGAGKRQVFFGGGGAFKPFKWLLPYLVVQEQISIGGEERRPDVNQLSVEAGSIVFGRGQSWYKVDLTPIVDFEAPASRLFGILEVGRLLFSKTGLFVRAGAQLAGRHELDYSLEVGARYLFRLGD